MTIEQQKRADFFTAVFVEAMKDGITSIKECGNIASEALIEFDLEFGTAPETIELAGE